jgi:thiol-disulfide isomerase/thioredoxin
LLSIGQSGYSQSVQVIQLPALEKLLATPNDTTYVINFWATWCMPCLEELPHLEEFNSKHLKDKVKVILISLDYASKLETKVKPLVQKKRLRSTVLLLNEPDQNAWIDQVDSQWSGAIPFTILLNNHQKKRQTFEKAFSKTELETIYQAFIQ